MLRMLPVRCTEICSLHYYIGFTHAQGRLQRCEGMLCHRGRSPLRSSNRTCFSASADSRRPCTMQTA